LSTTKAIINLGNFEHNVRYMQSIAKKAEIYPVIKANAYGHGFIRVARKIADLKLKGVCIATINELEELTNLNLNYSILHLGRLSFSDFSLYQNNNVIATINTLDDAKNIKKFNNSNKAVRAHIKVDTGMTRMGCDIKNFDKILNYCLKTDSISLEGIYSHLANSESRNSNYNKQQFKIFEKILNHLKGKSLDYLKIHLLNSGGLLNSFEFNSDIIRSGLALYGISPLKNNSRKLKPVMELKAPIVLNKNITKGTMIGYGCSYEAKKDMKVSMIQCGYGDGIPYEFSNQGFVYYNNKKIPIVGRVSMDLISIDTTLIDCKINEYVTIWGGSSSDSRVEEIASFFDSIPYTYITGITDRVIREYIDD
tara:strand:+ start:74 stop:1171 length:1098 start_codon:yes stop_codon:yes gene_type:complete